VDVDDELAAFCEREHPRLVGLLALYVGDVQVAEELAQDTLVRVCQHWPRVRRMADPTAWSTRVGLNLARSMFRRHAAGRRALARHGAADEAPTADTSAVIAVRTAVSELPPRMREAVIHRYFLGRSVAETAGAMGCAEGTVKALVHKAVRALRAAGLADDTVTQEARA
jgi:RNA polymerase sigma factor (sigma-70 family)